MTKPAHNSNPEQFFKETEWQWLKDMQAEAEQAQNLLSVLEMLKASDRLARAGAMRAKKQGLKPKDVNRLIHEFRSQKQF